MISTGVRNEALLPGRRRPRAFGTWGIQTDTGYARITDPQPLDATTVSYRLESLSGEIRLGDRPAADAMVYAERERIASFEEISYQAPLGAFPGRVANEGPGTWTLVPAPGRPVLLASGLPAYATSGWSPE